MSNSDASDLGGCGLRGKVCSLADTNVLEHQLRDRCLPIRILHAVVISIVSDLLALDMGDTYVTIEKLVRVFDIRSVAITR